jgi:hypothetical protein
MASPRDLSIFFTQLILYGGRRWLSRRLNMAAIQNMKTTRSSTLHNHMHNTFTKKYGGSHTAL